MLTGLRHVTFTSRLSVTLNVQSVIASCASMHCEFCLSMYYVTAHYNIFHAVAAAKFLYASTAWWALPMPL